MIRTVFPEYQTHPLPENEIKGLAHELLQKPRLYRATPYGNVWQI